MQAVPRAPLGFSMSPPGSRSTPCSWKSSGTIWDCRWRNVGPIGTRPGKSRPGLSNLTLAVGRLSPIFRRGLISWGAVRPYAVAMDRLTPLRGDAMTILKSLPKLVAALAIAVGLAGCGVNNIPTKDQTVKARWADVQAAYQRRNDLIPNLVNTVAGYAAQEKSVLTQVTQARASATWVSVDASTITDPAKFKQFEEAQNQLSGVLGRLLSISENYPDLKSNQNFLALQSQLEGTENRIE